MSTFIREMRPFQESFLINLQVSSSYLQVDGLYYNTNMCSRGIQLSGGMGREMANLIVSGCTEVDMFSYDINRYLCITKIFICLFV